MKQSNFVNNKILIIVNILVLGNMHTETSSDRIIDPKISTMEHISKMCNRNSAYRIRIKMKYHKE